MSHNASQARRWVGLIIFLVLLGLGAITYFAMSQPPPAPPLAMFPASAPAAWNL